MVRTCAPHGLFDQLSATVALDDKQTAPPPPSIVAQRKHAATQLPPLQTSPFGQSQDMWPAFKSHDESQTLCLASKHITSATLAVVPSEMPALLTSSYSSFVGTCKFSKFGYLRPFPFSGLLSLPRCSGVRLCPLLYPFSVKNGEPLTWRFRPDGPEMTAGVASP